MSNFSFNDGSSSLPAATKHLLIINVLCWLATFAFNKSGIGIDLQELFGLHYWKGTDFHIYQLATYMFLHSMDFSHLFFNMFALWMFGMVIERYWGTKFFVLFYFATGIGAGLCQELAWMYDMRGIEAEVLRLANSGIPNGVNVGDRIIYSVDELFSWLHSVYYNRLITVGASGAVFGLLAAFAMLFPNQPMYIMFIPIPIKAKYMMLGYAVLELFLGVQSFTGDNVAHFAHLGGAVVGCVLVLLWKRSRTSF